MDELQYQGLLDLMQPMEDSRPRFLGCFYGDLGTGKTVLSAQIAETLGGKWLYIDTADEFTTLTINPRWQHLTKFMIRMPYQGLSQISAISDAIVERKPGFDFDGIIIDKSSQISDRDLITVTRAKQSLAGLTEKDPDLPEWPHRNIAAVRFRDALNKLLKTNCHLIHIAGIRQDKDRLNIEKTGPAYPRSIYNAIADPMQMVAWVGADMKPTDTDQEQYIRWVQTLPSITVTAKCRIDGIGFKVPFSKIIEGIGAFARGERKLVTDDSYAPIQDDDNSIPVIY